MNPNSQRISIAVPAASCIAVIAFAVSLAVGATVDNPMGAVLARSLLVMVVSWPIGLIVGFVLEKLFREHASNQVAQTAQSDPSADEPLRDAEIVDESAGEPDSSVVEVPVASPSEAS